MLIRPPGGVIRRSPPRRDGPSWGGVRGWADPDGIAERRGLQLPPRYRRYSLLSVDHHFDGKSEVNDETLVRTTPLRCPECGGGINAEESREGSDLESVAVRYVCRSCRREFPKEVLET